MHFGLSRKATRHGTPIRLMRYLSRIRRIRRYALPIWLADNRKAGAQGVLLLPLQKRVLWSYPSREIIRCAREHPILEHRLLRSIYHLSWESYSPGA